VPVIAAAVLDALVLAEVMVIDDSDVAVEFVIGGMVIVISMLIPDMSILVVR
jgi:hypothetical protein